MCPGCWDEGEPYKAVSQARRALAVGSRWPPTTHFRAASSRTHLPPAITAWSIANSHCARQLSAALEKENVPNVHLNNPLPNLPRSTLPPFRFYTTNRSPSQLAHQIKSSPITARLVRLPLAATAGSTGEAPALWPTSTPSWFMRIFKWCSDSRRA